MRHHYPKLRFLPLGFLILCLFMFARPAAADTVQVLPQFVQDAPHDMINLQFQDENNAPHQLSDFKGQLMLVNLWATWCLPCRAEMSALDHLQLVYQKTKFRIVPISLDDPDDTDKIKRFYRVHEIKSLPIYRNPEFDLLKKLHPDGLPMSYLVMPDGKVVGHVEGIANWDGEEAANLIEAYLAKLPADSKPASK